VPHGYACQIEKAWLLVPLPNPVNPRLFFITVSEEFEDTKGKGVIRIRISKNRQHYYIMPLMAKRKSTKEQTTIYKTYI
jgi:hypothetical protein